MPFELVQGDITHQKTDAIVNAANERLQAGGGVCGAIFSAAGAAKLRAACDQLGHCPTGSAVLTPGFDLPARYVIHTVGPVWHGGNCGEEALLRSCYQSSLRLAKEKELTSVAFPLISAGIYGYPPAQALSVAVSAIGGFLRENDMTVRLVIYDRSSVRLPDGLRLSLESALRRNGPWERDLPMDQPPPAASKAQRGFPLLSALQARFAPEEETAEASQAPPLCSESAVSFDRTFAPPPGVLSDDAAPDHGDADLRGLKRALDHVEDGFCQTLFRLIDRQGRADPEVYKRANLDRKLFSKLRSNPAYRPSKNTALALCVALELNLDQTADLLRRAGYALSPASRADLIVEYFIREKNYDVFEINQALFYFDESLLGA